MTVLRELRIVAKTSAPVLWRAAPDGSASPGTVYGHALLFNTRSPNHEGFVEEIVPAAVDQTLNRADNVSAFRNHNYDHVLGRVSAGTLVLTKDPIGVRYDITLPSTTWGADTAETIKRNDAPGSSFGFSIVNGGEAWSVLPDGTPLRTITELRLWEVSTGVPFPYYPQTEDAGATALRSLAVRLGRSFDDVLGAARREQLGDLIASGEKRTVVAPKFEAKRDRPKASERQRLVRAAPSGQTSWGDIVDELDLALVQQYGWNAWIEDVGDGWLVYEDWSTGALWHLTWEITADGVVFTNPIQVVETYVPKGDPAAAVDPVPRSARSVAAPELPRPPAETPGTRTRQLALAHRTAAMATTL